MIFPKQYHPKNAVKKEPHGAFDIYHFENGALLTVRRKHVGVLFSPGKLIYQPIPKVDDEASRVLDTYAHGKDVFLARKENRGHFAPTYDGLLTYYDKIYAARARMEAPIAWLNEPISTHPHKTAIIVTKYRTDWISLYNKIIQIKDSVGGVTSTRQRCEQLSAVFEKVFHELGKLHGAGVRHGHPHLRNILLDETGNVLFVDPKVLGSINEVPKDLPHRDWFYFQHFPSLDPGAKFDLSWLTSQIKHFYPTPENLNWEKFGKEYARGVALSKKRVAAKISTNVST